MVKKFMDYFDDCVEYPQAMGCGEILPLGTLYQYVSHIFLNGLINYTGNVCRAYVAARYRTWDEPFDKVHTVAGRMCYTKQEIYDQVISGGKDYNTDIGCFGDDVIILTQTNRIWWYYWFDCDVSDCEVGRFETSAAKDIVINNFDRHILQEIACASALGTPKVLPTQFFSGWMSFKG